MPGVKHTKKTRDRVIANYRKLGRVDMATAAAGVDRSCHYDWLKKYPEYQRDFEACADQVAGLVEDLVKERAFEGVLEPVFSGGKQASMYARGPDGELLREDCGECSGAGVVGTGLKCPTCAGSGKSKKYVAVPAMVRKLSDACLLALAAARVPGFSQKVDHRLTDKDGGDRDLNVTVEYTDKTIPE